MGQTPWLCFDATILVNLDYYKLTGTLEQFKMQTNYRLITTTEIKNELSGQGSRKSSPNRATSTGILSAIDDGVIEVKDPTTKHIPDTAEYMKLGDGEISVVDLILDNSTFSPKPVFATDDRKAITQLAKPRKIETRDTAHYLSWAADQKLIKCGRAIDISLTLFAREPFKRQIK